MSRFIGHHRVRSNTRNIHPSVTPSAALQLSVGFTYMRVYKSAEMAQERERDIGY